MRFTKRTVALLLALVLTASSVVCVQAAAPENNTVMPLYDYANTASATLIISGTNANCKSSVVGIKGVTTKIVTKMTLQKKTLWWTNVTSWEATFNSTSGTLSKTKSITAGTYRVKAVSTVYCGANSEKITVYSTEKTL